VLTREGIVTLIIAVAVFLLATNLASGLLFALDAILVALLVVGAVTAYGPTRRITLSRRAPAHAVEGVAVSIETTVVADRAARFITIEEGWRGTRARAMIAHLAAGTPVTITVAVVPRRRGHYTFAPAQIISRGPVGLVAVRRNIPSFERIVVWPQTQPVAREILATLLPANGGGGGAERTPAAEDLYGLRDYQRGDRLARVHWRSSLRRGVLVVRDYERPRALALTIIVDLDRRQSAHRLDAAVRAAASILHAAVAMGADVVMAGWNGRYVERHGFETTMAWLAGLEPSGPPLAAVLDALPAGASRERRLIIISSAGTPPPLPEGTTAILPAEDAPGRGCFVYSADGTVHRW
jgi:uncharacterized protein (DUF58 family)